MQNKIIVTSASNRFFPWLLNFIWSVQKNYPNHEKLIIYSLWLNKIFLSELKNIENIEIREVPKVVQFWKNDFTWKLLIFEDLMLNYENSLIFYIDYWATVLKSLNDIFEIIKKDWYFFVDQWKTNNLTKSIPKDYMNNFNINIIDIENKFSVAAWFTWFNSKNEIIKNIIFESSNFAKKWYCLNKGIPWDNLKRNCDVFRNDQSVLSMLLFNKIENPIIHNMTIYWWSPSYIAWQYVHSHRRLLKNLPYINSIKFKNVLLTQKIIIKTNRLLIKSYFKTEKILVKTSYLLNNINKWNSQS